MNKGNSVYIHQDSPPGRAPHETTVLTKSGPSPLLPLVAVFLFLTAAVTTQDQIAGWATGLLYVGAAICALAIDWLCMVIFFNRKATLK